MNTVTTTPSPATNQERAPMPTDADYAVRMRAITKTYGSLHAVNGINLEIHRGETVALLGPNGAGKSTTINMLLGLLEPTSGSIAVFGSSPREATQRSQIGAMLQEGKLMSGVTIAEFLDFVRSLHPAPLPTGKLIALSGLTGLERRRIDRLSGGQTQRVRFAMAIAGDPDLLVLDEPTAALDVEARREFWASMRAYADQGHTVLFATHYLEEAETFASRLIVIARGQIIADGTVQQIESRFGEPRVSFTIPASAHLTPAAYAHLAAVRRSEALGDRIILHTQDADATARALFASPIPWQNLEVRSSNLEETFMKLVHKDENQGAAQ